MGWDNDCVYVSCCLSYIILPVLLLPCNLSMIKECLICKLLFVIVHAFKFSCLLHFSTHTFIFVCIRSNYCTSIPIKRLILILMWLFKSLHLGSIHSNYHTCFTSRSTHSYSQILIQIIAPASPVDPLVGILPNVCMCFLLGSFSWPLSWINTLNQIITLASPINRQ